MERRDTSGETGEQRNRERERRKTNGGAATDGKLIEGERLAFTEREREREGWRRRDVSAPWSFLSAALI